MLSIQNGTARWHSYDKDKCSCFDGHDPGPESQAITSASHLFIERLITDVADLLVHAQFNREQDFQVGRRIASSPSHSLQNLTHESRARLP